LRLGVCPAGAHRPRCTVAQCPIVHFEASAPLTAHKDSRGTACLGEVDGHRMMTRICVFMQSCLTSARSVAITESHFVEMFPTCFPADRAGVYWTGFW